MQTQTHSFFILFILTLTQSIKSQETQCNDIKPKSAADCKLANSGNDKAWNKYCCFKKPQYGSPASCVAYWWFPSSEPCYNETNLPPNDCEYIVPEKTSDCVLSENDRKKYDFCCYKYYNGIKSCAPDTENGYEYNKILYKDTKEDIYDCQISKEYQGCESIIPEKASDCVLSENDKKKYDYCCYVLDGGKKSCSAETKDSYETFLSVFKAYATNEDIFDCGVNKGSFMDLSNILLVLIIILNMCV